MNSNNELKQAVNDYIDSYDRAARESRAEYMQTLPAGAQVPAEGRIYTQRARDQFAGVCSSCRAKADAVFSEARKEIDNQVAAAPDADAVNTLSMLKLRSNVPQAELETLAEKYLGNVQTYSALQAIAKNSGHILPDHPIEERRRELDGLQRSINRMFSIPGHSDPAPSRGLAEMISMQIDDVFSK